MTARRLALTSALTASALGLMGAGLAAPASAATAGETPVQFVVTAGELAITVPVIDVTLDAVTDSLVDASAAALLGRVTVTDARGGAVRAGWIVSAISTPFTSTTGNVTTTLPASDVDYNPGVLAKSGTITATGTPRTGLAASVAVVNGTARSTNNSAHWNPELSVLVPSGTANGTYSGVITHSVV